MDYAARIVVNIWQVTLEAAPWLLLGLLAAGIIKAWMPQRWIARAMGGRGIGAVLRAAVIGIPLPLCSCGVLPTAIGLRRQGASRSATTAFLISTPEIGLDSFALSYALLGPFMAIARPISAFISALFTGLMVAAVEAFTTTPPPSGEDVAQRQEGAHGDTSSASCCHAAQDTPATPSGPLRSEASQTTSPEGGGVWARLADGLKYVLTTLLDDIKLWLAIAVIVAGVVYTVFPEPAAALQQWGSGPLAKLVMLIVGIPLYVCATASTPIAAGLLVAGVSPGTVLVLLLAGPATNIGSIVVLKKELGGPIVATYLAGIAITSLACGIAVDMIARSFHIEIKDQLAHVHQLAPMWAAWTAAFVLIFFAIKPLRRLVIRPVKPAPTAGASCCGK